MPGRRRQELSGDGPGVELARRLRALRDERGLTLRDMAARSGYSQASMSVAESGRRVPSWDIIAAFVQSCESDPHQWRQLWEVASSTSNPPPAPEDLTSESLPPDEAAMSTPDQPARHEPEFDEAPISLPLPLPVSSPADDYAVAPPSVRLLFSQRRKQRRLVVSSLALAAVVIAAVLSLTINSRRGSPTGPAAPLATTVSSAASATQPIRRTGTVVLTPGEYIDLDSAAADWGKGFAPDSVPHELAFSQGVRTLLTDNAVFMAILSDSVDRGYQNCLSGASGQPLTPAMIKPGLGLCVTTKSGRRVLIVITDVHADAANLPDRLTLHITVWEYQPDPVVPALPSHSTYDRYACVGGEVPDSVMLLPADPRGAGWQSSRPSPWGASQCADQIWWTPYVNGGANPAKLFSWIFATSISGPARCALWAYYPPPPSGHSGGTAHYSVNDGSDLSGQQLGYLAVSQSAYWGTWHGLGTYTFTSGHISVTLDNSGTHLKQQQGVIAGPMHAVCY